MHSAGSGCCYNVFERDVHVHAFILIPLHDIVALVRLYRYIYPANCSRNVSATCTCKVRPDH